MPHLHQPGLRHLQLVRGWRTDRTNHLDVANNLLDVDPEYSPDGRAIAFSSFNRGGVPSAVYLMGAHGFNVRRLTDPALQAENPDWAPSRSSSVFGTHCCDGQATAIATERIDGTSLVQLTSPGTQYDFTPEYAPDGDRIVFERDSADSSSFGLVTISRGGTGVRAIQDTAFAPEWGPAQDEDETG